jgi:hypothetical protein
MLFKDILLASCMLLWIPAAFPQGATRQLQLPSSSGNSTLTLSSGVYSVAGSITIPSTVNLQVAEGALIHVPEGETLTIQGNITAGSYRIFSGPGTVSFSGNKSLSILDVKWWGASGDGVTDDTALLQSAFVASTTGAHRFAVHLPAATYRACNLFLGNPKAPGCPTGAECPAPARVYGDGGASVLNTKLQATASCGENPHDFVVVASSMSSFTLEDLAIDGNASAVPGTGASCLDASWKWFAAPATKNVYRDLDLEGCKDAAGAYGMNANQLNDATFNNLSFGYRSKRPTGLPVAFSLLAEGGQAGSISNFRIYGAAPLQIDVQNGQIQDSYLTGGLVIGFSGTHGGVSTNHLLLNNVQIDQNLATGIVINGVKTTGSTAALQDLICNACTLSTVGLTAGQAIFSGAWLTGASINGGQINAGKGSIFGSHFTPASGNSPVFFFRGAVLTGSIPTAGSNRDVVLEGAFNASNGTIVNTSSLKTSGVNGSYGNQGYFASTGSVPAGIVIDNKAGGQQSQITFNDAGSVKYSLGKGATNYWFLYDALRRRNVLTVEPALGTLIVGAPMTSGDAAPAIAMGAGAGAAATVALAGHTNAGKITVNTGTAPRPSSPIATITFHSAVSNDAYCGIFPANPGAAGLSAGSAPYIRDTSYTGFSLSSSAVPLPEHAQFTWTYLCF